MIYGVLPVIFSHLRALVVIMSNITQDRDATRRCVQRTHASSYVLEDVGTRIFHEGYDSRGARSLR